MLLTQDGTYPCAGGGEQIIGNGDIARLGLPRGQASRGRWSRKIGGRIQPVFQGAQLKLPGKGLLPGQLLFTPKGIVPLLGLQILGHGLTAQGRGQDQAECPNDGRP